MQAAEASRLRQRAQRLLAGPIPASVAHGGVSAVIDYKRDLLAIAGFVRRGTGADKANLAVLRVEGMLRGAAGRESAASDGGAARSATPPSNTGVNGGRTWLLGSGL